MKFEEPLIRATLGKRYKRFLADVRLEDGSEVTAHCANPGSMMGLMVPGSTVWLSPNRNPKAKLPYRWEMIEVEGGLVGINTSRPNCIVEEAISEARVPELKGFETMRREVKYGRNSRIDLLLEEPGRCYVEVKSVTLRRQGFAEFPDAVTARGAKHLRELSDMISEGHRAVMLYLVQRTDCQTFRLARDIDPEYGAAFDAAKAVGVETLVYGCRLTGKEITLAAPLHIHP
jgi:sugar fermentation stimulation protein A